MKWYTRYLEVVVLARAWRFNSSHPHQGRLAQLVDRDSEMKESRPRADGLLAQLVERFIYTEDVGGSSPLESTSGGVVPLTRDLRRVRSLHRPHKYLKVVYATSRGSQGGHGGCLKNIRCQFDSDPRHRIQLICIRFIQFENLTVQLIFAMMRYR